MKHVVYLTLKEYTDIFSGYKVGLRIRHIPVGNTDIFYLQSYLVEEDNWTVGIPIVIKED